MKALVTGATGFIGSRLVRELARQGMEVRSLILPGEPAGHIRDYTTDIRRGNLDEPQSLKGLLKGIDLVFHLAARVTDWGSRQAFYRPILDGTRNLLEESREKGARFVYVSSIAACGLGRHLKGMRESDEACMSGVPYNDAKLEAERIVRSFHDQGLVNAVIVRPANVTGPGSVWVRDIVDRFKGLFVPLLDHGRYSASLVYVDNLVSGLVLAGTRPRAVGNTYHLRDDWDVTWKRYLTDLGAMMGKRPGFSIPFSLAWTLGALSEKILTPLNIRPPITRLTAAIMGRDNDVDTTKARTELGWDTHVSYEQALAEIRAWVDDYLRYE
ncbi:MAG: NAD-dependent epimerase/dehydratase family protein [Desulfomonilia bacterium]|jgi:nucleoside-diphosphate-sugar epimerase|nr:NAD-dependent epimerase/dehydratase family protein [Deltaproteobacteria bacterium]MDX9762486.1 NAD-dependent epimerase/dehydratase family protein [Desulfomonilia bacterium]HPW68022.1 NAD-dependent epimerase/dehydratase family protein [Deltaproteobacteria bacterium]